MESLWQSKPSWSRYTEEGGETHAECAYILAQGFRSTGVGEPVVMHREFQETSQWGFSSAVPVNMGAKYLMPL